MSETLKEAKGKVGGFRNKNSTASIKFSTHKDPINIQDDEMNGEQSETQTNTFNSFHIRNQSIGVPNYSPTKGMNFQILKKRMSVAAKKVLSNFPTPD